MGVYSVNFIHNWEKIKSMNTKGEQKASHAYSLLIRDPEAFKETLKQRSMSPEHAKPERKVFKKETRTRTQGLHESDQKHEFIKGLLPSSHGSEITTQASESIQKTNLCTVLEDLKIKEEESPEDFARTQYQEALKVA